MFRKNILSAYLTSILGVFSGLLTQFVYIKSLSARLSIDDLSLYLYVFQVISYFAILQLGLDFATSREIAFKLGQGDFAGAAYSFKFIKKFNDRLCFIGLFVILVISTTFYNGWGLPKSYNRTTSLLLVLIFGSSQVINFLANPFAVALIGGNFQRIVNINNVLVNISSTILAIVLLLTTKAGILAMPISLLFFYILNFILLKRIAKRKCIFLNETYHTINTKAIRKQILNFSILTTFGGLAWTIEATSDVFILNSNGFFSLVALYVIWWRFPQMLFDLATRLTTSSIPSLAATAGEANTSNKLLFNRLFIIIIGFSLLIGTGIILWLPSFINLWVGKKFYFEKYLQLSVVIGLIIGFRIVGNCFSMFIISRGMVKVNTFFSWLQAITKLLVGIFLTQKFGLIGLFYATLISALLQVVGLGIIIFRLGLFIQNSYLFCFCLIVLPIIFMCTGVPYVSMISIFAFGVFLTTILIALLWSGLIYLGNYHIKLSIPLPWQIVKKVHFQL